MRSEVSHPTHQCPQSLRKRDLRQKPGNLLESDEQCPGAPLSHLHKIPSATSGSIVLQQRSPKVTCTHTGRVTSSISHHFKA